MSINPAVWKVTVTCKESGDRVSYLIAVPENATDDQLRSEALKTLRMFADTERAVDGLIVWLLEVALYAHYTQNSETIESFLRFLSRYLWRLADVAEFVKRNPHDLASEEIEITKK